MEISNFNFGEPNALKSVQKNSIQEELTSLTYREPNATKQNCYLIGLIELNVIVMTIFMFDDSKAFENAKNSEFRSIFA